MGITREKFGSLVRLIKNWYEGPRASCEPLQHAPKELTIPIRDKPAESFETDSPWLGREQPETETNPLFTIVEPLLAPVSPPVEEKAPERTVPIEHSTEPYERNVLLFRLSERARIGNHFISRYRIKD